MFFVVGMQKSLDFFCGLWYDYIVIFLISATDGISGFTTVEQRSILPTVWAHFFPCGVSVPFFIFGDFLLNFK